MVDAAEPHADDEDDRQPQLLGEIGRVALRPERYAKAADAFDQHCVGESAQGVERVDDTVDVDRAAFFGGGDVRRNRRVKEIGIDEFARRLDARCGNERFNVLVPALLVGTGGDRLHPHGLDAMALQVEEQGAGGEGFADFGIGAGDEPGRGGCWGGAGSDHFCP